MSFNQTKAFLRTCPNFCKGTYAYLFLMNISLSTLFVSNFHTFSCIKYTHSRDSLTSTCAKPQPAFKRYFHNLVRGAYVTEYVPIFVCVLATCWHTITDLTWERIRIWVIGRLGSSYFPKISLYAKDIQYSRLTPCNIVYLVYFCWSLMPRTCRSFSWGETTKNEKRI